MRLKSLTGKDMYKNTNKYRVDWGKKSRSKIQKQIKEYCEKIWANEIVFEEFPVYGSRMTLDLFNATKKIAIEIQGAQHTAFNPFFHNNDRGKYLHQLKKDEKKLKFCEINGIVLIEIFEEEMKKIKTINDFIKIYNKILTDNGR